MIRLISTTTCSHIRASGSRGVIVRWSSSSSPPTPSSTPTTPPTAATTASSSSPSSSSHLTPKEAHDKKLELDSTPPPPYLSRAPGIATRPTKIPPTREEWRKQLLSQSRRLNERQHLVKQVAKGYFHDYNELRNRGGKSWLAPKTLIRDDVSLHPSLCSARTTD